jgi:hypothetical protein
VPARPPGRRRACRGARLQNWAHLLLEMIASVKAKGLSGAKLVSELQVPAKATQYSSDGYTYHPELGISVQGQSAQDAWKEIERIANKWAIPVDVEFQWRQNKKAQHPGRSAFLRAGGKEIERPRTTEAPPQRWPQQIFNEPEVSGEAANRRYDEHAKKNR